MVADPHHDIDDDESGAGDRAAVHRVVTTTVLPWLRFVGPGRILGAVGAALVLVGIAWWMLRSPAVPTESRLPLAQRVEAAVADVNTTSSGAPTTLMPTTSVASVVIHVTGAVRTPGVYELHPGDRVADAIAAAGGALADADADALNLAAPVADGDRIAVPTVGESGANGGEPGHVHAGTAAGVGEPAVIDLNTADIDALETLPGIGPATAAAIVDHRDENGPFASIDELEAVRGIGPAKVEAIRDRVRV